MARVAEVWDYRSMVPFNPLSRCGPGNMGSCHGLRERDPLSRKFAKASISLARSKSRNIEF
ncbi:hypothetical protein VFPPC_16697 [Pochonia chlamydosporia 170]|uniref:Uncharacterized protein n=1 Tax=Pochonia chlamydosporia 170 TaxID=1380566 RepID=A0A179F6R2_METCM|nr:hypothetical protein VFPPC_16697 [Pochonia chlamydosporia 170]OAQ61087.1 hypothetical protein VFPPC_16697 [Pochonia chlamydosporia 170]